jgi:hypothetical protein
MEYIGPDKIRELIPRLDSEVFVPEVFNRTGIFVIRKAIPSTIMQIWHKGSGSALRLHALDTTG